MSDGLSKALEESMEIFKKISAVVATFQAPEHDSSPGNFQKAKWAFKEKTVDHLRKELTECKITLNIAICIANE